MSRKILARTVCAAALSLGGHAALAQSVTINGGGATLPQPTYQSEFTEYTNSNPTILFSYDGVGSGAGQSAFLNNEISLFNSPSTQYGTQVGSTVHFSASDAFLTQAQVTTTGGYMLSGTDGPLIQLPMIGVAVTIPYNNAGQGTTPLKLTDDQLCGVMSGTITQWSQLTTKPRAAGAITVVYRSDGSGTSFLLTQHLSAVCTSANSNFVSYPVPITTHFNTDFTGGSPPANFVQASGSSGVATTMLNTPLSIGYLSPDFTSIAPGSTNTTSLLVASLVNATNNVAYQPSLKNIELGLNNAGPGSSNATPPATAAAAANPVNWVPAIPVTNSGYPIVGYTTWELSTCYADKTIGKDLISFLNDHYKLKAYASIINNNGFATLSNTKAVKYVTAVRDTFLTNVSGYNLNIDNTTTCRGLAGR